MNFFDSTFQWLENNLLPCPFKSITGCDCPGCGLQRSILSLAKGEVVQSIEIHPAGIPFVVLTIFIILQIKFKWTFAPRVMFLLMMLIVLISTVNYAIRWSAGTICS
jgi:hypothetical protein